MRNKELRLETIKSILNSQVIDSQEALRKAILKRGIDVQQGTLSRDLHQMRVAKVNTQDGLRYLLPDHPLYERVYAPVLKDDKPTLTPQGFTGLHLSGQMAVIHTLPGYAQALCAALDAAQVGCILGTVAGHDTILAVLMADTTEKELQTALKKAKIMPDT